MFFAFLRASSGKDLEDLRFDLGIMEGSLEEYIIFYYRKKKCYPFLVETNYIFLIMDGYLQNGIP